MGKRQKDLTFFQHLEELRARLILSIIAIVITTAVGLFVSKSVLQVLMLPIKNTPLFASLKNPVNLRINITDDGELLVDKDSLAEVADVERISEIEIYKGEKKLASFNTDSRSKLYYFSPTDPLMLRLKAALLIGIILAIPIWFYQLWAFIRPGLTSKEKKGIKPVILLSFLLFPIGAGFAYYMVRFALAFLMKFGMVGLEPRLDILKYVSFLLTLMIAFGAVFETPIIIMFLIRIGVVSTKFLREKRGIAFIIILIISATLTPPDPVTMIGMAVPLYLLYEISIYLGKLIEQRKETI